MWASDYPHPDSVWPNARAVEEQIGPLSPELRRKLTHENAVALLGLGSSLTAPKPAVGVSQNRASDDSSFAGGVA